MSTTTAIPNDTELDNKVKKASERISENMHIVANEPSLAFYRLQEHVRKVMPAMVQKRVDVSTVYKDLQGCCYDVEYAVSTIKSMDNATKRFASAQKLLNNAIFLKQQLKYEENRRIKRDPQSAFKRLSAHITLDFPDLPEAIRETASKVESMMGMTQGKQSGQTNG